MDLKLSNVMIVWEQGEPVPKIADFWRFSRSFLTLQRCALPRQPSDASPDSRTSTSVIRAGLNRPAFSPTPRRSLCIV
jgi:hypothetical protein